MKALRSLAFGLPFLLLAACSGDDASGGGADGGGGAGEGGKHSHPSGGNGAGGPGSGGGGSQGNGGSSGTAGGGHTGPGTFLAGCPFFPADNPWNTDITDAELDPLGEQYLASMGLDTGLHPDFGTDFGIPFIIVDNGVTKVPVSFDEDDESDPGPYPLPDDAPIEPGDGHVLAFHKDECKLYELGDADFSGGDWSAYCGAIFDTTSNALRHDGWTSADAAGLPILAGLARYEEAAEDGVIHHALRFTAGPTQNKYAYPARHSAGQSGANLPPMGLRLRLKESVDISGFSPPVRAILQALKTYGMILADNGSNWYISGANNPGWDDDTNHDEFELITGKDFEVLKTGPLKDGD